MNLYKCLPFKYSSIVSQTAIVWHFPCYEKKKKKEFITKTVTRLKNNLRNLMDTIKRGTVNFIFVVVVNEI